MKKQTNKSALSREFEKFLADLESLLHTAGDTGGEELQEVKEKISERVADARESVVEFSEDMKRSVHNAASSVNHGVHEEPWKAVGASAALGLFLGFLFARR